MVYSLKTFRKVICRVSCVTITLLLSLTSSLELASNHLVIKAVFTQAATTQDRKLEVSRLLQQGLQQYQQGKFQQALEIYQQVLSIVHELGDKSSEVQVLDNMVEVYVALDQYPKALETFQQGLAVRQQINKNKKSVKGLSYILGLIQAAFNVPGVETPKFKASILTLFGEFYGLLDENYRAIGLYQHGLAIYKQLGDRPSQTQSLSSIAAAYNSLKEYSRAVEYYQQVLTIYKELDNKTKIGNTLTNISEVYLKQKEYAKTLEFYQQALAVYQELKNQRKTGDTLHNIGRVYRQWQQYAQALKFYQQALTIRQQVGNQMGIGVTSNDIGLTYSYLSQYPQAINYYQKALAIFQELSLKKETAKKARTEQGVTLNNIAEVYLKQKEYSKALEFYQQALAVYQELKNQTKIGDTLHQIGGVYRQWQQYAQALEFYQQALTIRKDVNARREQGITLNDTGLVYYNQQQYSKALEYYQQALAIHKEVGSKAGEGTTLDNLGLVYNKLNQYPKALEFYQQALVIRKEINDKPGQGSILKNIGEVYKNLKQYPKALEYYQQALAIDKEISDKEKEATTHIQIGEIYKAQGQYGKALDAYQQALIVGKDLDNKVGKEKLTRGELIKLIVLGFTGFVYENLGQDSKLLEFIEQLSVFDADIGYALTKEFQLRLQASSITIEIGDDAEGKLITNSGSLDSELSKFLKSKQESLAKARKDGKRVEQVGAINSIGTVYNAAEQYDKALEFYQQALAIIREIGDKDDQQKATTLNYIGVAYYKLNQYPKAVGFFQQALAIYTKFGSKAQQGKTLNNIGVVYNKIDQYQNAEKTLFAAIEIWEYLRQSELKDADKISVFEAHTKTYRLLQQSLVAQNKINMALEIAERGRARAFVDLLAAKISLKPDNQVNIKPPKIEEIQQIAQQQKATLVEYSVNKSNLYIWVIKPTGEVAFKQVNLKSLNKPLADLVNNARVFIGAGGRGAIDIKPTGESIQKQNLQTLYQLLISPIAPLLPKNPDEHIIFIPHESLFLVPFAALQDKDGKYLIEKHTILTAPAIQVLELTRKQRQRLTTKDVLVMGNPTMPKVGVPPVQLQALTGAEMEAVTIASLLKTKAITGKDATKAAFTSKLSSARIIHLATHGLLDDPSKGIKTAIALAPSGQDDGLLTPAEIVNLKINAELVVLSACDTGRGTITGDGVIGLSRSLLTAGAPSVIVSLWSVPDSPTAELMKQFYENWQQNPDKAKALRSAMLTTMKKHREAIKNWAAFTLIGEST